MSAKTVADVRCTMTGAIALMMPGARFGRRLRDNRCPPACRRTGTSIPARSSRTALPQTPALKSAAWREDAIPHCSKAFAAMGCRPRPFGASRTGCFERHIGHFMLHFGWHPRSHPKSSPLMNTSRETFGIILGFAGMCLFAGTLPATRAMCGARFRAPMLTFL